MPTSPTSPLAWTVHPMRESTGKSILFWTVVVITIWAVWWNIMNVPLTLLAGLALLASLGSFYLPTHYRLDEHGAEQRRWPTGRCIAWERVKSIVDEKQGVFLSSYPVKSRMENFRGVYLSYRGNRDEVLGFIAEVLPEVKGLPGAFRVNANAYANANVNDDDDEAEAREVLGVDGKTDIEGVEKAYRSLMEKYTAEKFEGLGEEFRESAEVRRRKIRKAYRRILGRAADEADGADGDSVA